MLFIQDICLSWHKEERSAEYAKVRTGFPMAYAFDNIPGTFHGDALVHRLDFWQKRTKVYALQMNEQYHFQFYASVQDLNLTNILIQSGAKGYTVNFFYDQNRSGRPVRQGHNKDYHNVDSPLYCHDILNETAFFLEKGQYGRILWNERTLDYDTGEWYFQIHGINFVHSTDLIPEIDIFLARKPDYEYKQMAVLF